MEEEFLNLSLTLRSGQAFYWGHLEGGRFVFGKPDKGGIWWGVARNRVWALRQRGGDVEVLRGDLEEFRVLFSFDKDYHRILKEKAKRLNDAPLLKAFELFPGLRMMRQDPWETTVSFLLSPQNRVERIALGTYLLAKEYGDDTDLLPLYPTPQALANSDTEFLKNLPVRYEVQAFRLREVARMIHGNPHFWDDLPQDYYGRRRYLRVLPGVGNKIADCILAYGFGDGRAVPIDTHILRISKEYYGFNPKSENLTNRLYDAIGDFYRERYGDLSALAQLYLYALARLG
ncbi:MAG: hypothetical protein GXO39_07360 [Thermotogae bacterium]|nr:hypothetical protein [Thermotogota bacterium]